MTKPKKKPEPTILTGPANQTYTITITERGLRIDVDDRHRLVYTSILSGLSYISFQVEPTDRRATRELGR